MTRKYLDLSGDLECAESDIREIYKTIFETGDYPTSDEEADICRDIAALRLSIQLFMARVSRPRGEWPEAERPIMIGRRGYGVV